MHRSFLDKLGVLGSSICTIHCFACLFLPTILAALGFSFLLNASVEWSLTIVAVVVASGALVIGYKKHQSKQVAVFFLIGIVGLVTARVIEFSHGHHHDEPSSAISHEEEHDAHEHTDVIIADHGSEAAGELLGILSGCFVLVGHLQSIRLSGSSEGC